MNDRYPDGNVVLYAQGFKFRVHQSVIARHSSVLDRMVMAASQARPSIPHNSPGSAEAVEIYLSDTAYDLDKLLRFMYGDIKPANYRSPNTTPFPVLAALIRMGHKYGVERLLDSALACLADIFPRDLSVWDNRAAIRARHAFYEHHAIEAFNLLRMLQRAGGMDEPDLVPLGLYVLCQIDTNVVWGGAWRADGTHEELSLGDFELVFYAKNQLLDHGARMVERCAGFQPAGGCTRGGGGSVCEAVVQCALHAAKEGLLWGDPLSAYFLDCLDANECTHEHLHGERVDNDNCTNACAACVGPICALFEDMRGDVWMDLPKIAGVWDELSEWWVDDQ